MWPKCLGAVRKANIKFPHQLVVGGGGNYDGEAAGAEVLSTFYVLIWSDFCISEESPNHITTSLFFWNAST